MAKHPCYHAWHACDGLEEDEANQPFLLAHGIGLGLCKGVSVADFLGGFDVVAVASGGVHSETEHAHHEEGYSVGEILGFAVGEVDVFSHLLGIIAGTLVSLGTSKG